MILLGRFVIQREILWNQCKSVVGAYHNGSNELEVSLLHLDWYEWTLSVHTIYIKDAVTK